MKELGHLLVRITHDYVNTFSGDEYRLVDEQYENGNLYYYDGVKFDSKSWHYIKHDYDRHPYMKHTRKAV